MNIDICLGPHLAVEFPSGTICQAHVPGGASPCTAEMENGRHGFLCNRPYCHTAVHNQVVGYLGRLLKATLSNGEWNVLVETQLHNPSMAASAADEIRPDITILKHNSTDPRTTTFLDFSSIVPGKTLVPGELDKPLKWAVMREKAKRAKYAGLTILGQRFFPLVMEFYGGRGEGFSSFWQWYKQELKNRYDLSKVESVLSRARQDISCIHRKGFINQFRKKYASKLGDPLDDWLHDNGS